MLTEAIQQHSISAHDVQACTKDQYTHLSSNIRTVTELSHVLNHALNNTMAYAYLYDTQQLLRLHAGLHINCTSLEVSYH